MTGTADIQTADLAARVLAGEQLDNLPSQHFIDGTWQASEGGAMLDTYDPGCAEVWHQIPAGTVGDAEQAVASSQQAFEQWRKTTPAQRAEVMQNAARLIGENAERLAVIESLDCGKSLVDAEWDIGTVQKYLNYYAGAADKLEGDTIPWARI
ncbi:aldehyde dehydrogenase family protein [Aliamphritea spongicola]|nr:aldehyde dehydrogenase family protein [Aliamphritea spongicola]